MMPSLFSMSSPTTWFQVWFVVYVYLLPILLYAAWSALSLMDIVESGKDRTSLGAILAVMLIPLLGGGWYLIARARVLTRTARLAAVVLGSLAWLIPLAVAIWLVGRPLGPKALT